ncbi:hypothetical protein RHGRI_005825 [Rhododendron griersonianum]|uniref:Glutathione S-transferase n=1 Tax=Rhododendron griersonianum TaxID=479676 RepID=A0AAV6LEV8_9ERIC|nr:hypothetical protein RHGRI_005825 [Rhododendron griersonianum]
MGLKIYGVYGHRMCQPARAVYVFCKMNGIDFEEITVNFFTRETSSPEFQVMQFLGIWLVRFPAFQIIVTLVQAIALAPKFGRQPNVQAAAEAEKHLCESLEKIETVWLKESRPFLLGNSQPSIADLILVCEIIQLEINGLYPMLRESAILGEEPVDKT